MSAIQNTHHPALHLHTGRPQYHRELARRQEVTIKKAGDDLTRKGCTQLMHCCSQLCKDPGWIPETDSLPKWNALIRWFSDVKCLKARAICEGGAAGRGSRMLLQGGWFTPRHTGSMSPHCSCSPSPRSQPWMLRMPMFLLSLTSFCNPLLYDLRDRNANTEGKVYTFHF